VSCQNSDMPDLTQQELFLSFCKNTAHSAGAMALEYFRKPLKKERKKDNSVVTEADLAVQKFIESQVAEAYPEHCFFGEELGKSESSGLAEFRWVVDPIDGTTVFSQGLPGWAVSIGLLHRDRPLVGCVYLPVTDEMYSAAHDLPSLWIVDYSGQAVTHVNEVVKDHDPRSFLTLTGSEFHRRFDSNLPGKQRSLGSTAHHLCLVARGIGNISFMRPFVWDIAAAGLILERAGGSLLCWEDEQPYCMEEHMAPGTSRPVIAAVNNVETLRLAKKLIVRKIDK